MGNYMENYRNRYQWFSNRTTSNRISLQKNNFITDTGTGKVKIKKTSYRYGTCYFCTGTWTNEFYNADNNTCSNIHNWVPVLPDTISVTILINYNTGTGTCNYVTRQSGTNHLNKKKMKFNNNLRTFYPLHGTGTDESYNAVNDTGGKR